MYRVLSGPKFWGGNRGGRAGVIIVKQVLCVFNCLINKFGEPLVGETDPTGLYADKPMMYS